MTWSVYDKSISIHALREESDTHYRHVVDDFLSISIHALREESDSNFLKKTIDS